MDSINCPLLLHINNRITRKLKIDHFIALSDKVRIEIMTNDDNLESNLLQLLVY